VVLLSVSLGLAGQIIVSPGGRDSNNGSKNNPYRTIQKAADNAGPGDTVYIREGTYKPSDKITIKRSGTKNAWVTFSAYGDEKPVVDGSKITEDPTDKYGLIFAQEKDYIRIQGLQIQESRFMGIKLMTCENVEILDNYIKRTFSCGIGVWGCRGPWCRTKTWSKNVKALRNHVELTNNCDLATSANGNCMQKNKAPHEAISFASVDGFEIAYNHVHHGKKEGIDAKGCSRNGTIHHNHVHHHKNTPYTVGIYADAWWGELFNIEIYENVVHDCDDGISVAAEGKAYYGTLTRDVYVHHNVVYNFKWRGITLDKATNNSKRENIWIYNNTVHNATQSGIWVNTENVEDIFIFNNIATGGSARIRNDVPDNKTVKIYNNLIDKAFPKTFTGENVIIADPRYKDTSAFDFSLTAGSPAINAGVADTKYNDPDGSRGDLGALYYTGDGATDAAKSFHLRTTRNAPGRAALYSVTGRRLGTRIVPGKSNSSSLVNQVIIVSPRAGRPYRRLYR
jgi:hypothetical protein